MVGHDVVVHGVVAVARPVWNPATETLVPAHPEVELVVAVFDRLEVRIVHPDRLGFWIRPSREHAGWHSWVAALDHEGRVVNRTLGHGVSPCGSWCITSGPSAVSAR